MPSDGAGSMAEFLSDIVLNKILVALAIAYPIAAVWLVQRLRRDQERERQARRLTFDRVIG